MTNTQQSTHKPTVLSFSASDPSSGAGLQADLLTLASLGVHASTVVTGLTVQDTCGVEEIYPTEPDIINQQARLILEDMPIHAFKAGVIGGINHIACVASILNDYPNIPFVLDPVLASGRGDPFIDDKSHQALCDLLLPYTTIVTPNSIEASRLCDLDDPSGNIEDDTCAEILLNYGCEYVLITGGHAPTSDIINRLYNEDGLVLELFCPRLPGQFHGSGCTLASAIAAFIAQGKNVIEAVQCAHEYTWQTLKHAYAVGMGQLIPQRLWQNTTRTSKTKKPKK